MQKTVWLLLPALVLLASIAYLFSLGTAPEETPPEHLGWIESTVTPQGIVFSYPRDFDNDYFTPAEWPPLVERVENEYSCSLATGTDGSVPQVEERVIDGRIYCITTTGEGAAGSTYVTYEYSTDRGDAVLRTVFTIRFPQCLNYDEPNQSACKSEQSAFDPDALAQGLIESARLPYVTSS